MLLIQLFCLAELFICFYWSDNAETDQNMLFICFYWSDNAETDQNMLFTCLQQLDFYQYPVNCYLISFVICNLSN